ncbi:flavin reductase family protein [Parvularcula marina]|uniref:Flavin reductase n=1 Tax=Parvularcula marina TaxID=2292771 RepID=A0A371RGZ8_9PROT|nr:flavin reductase family protein [Parvularcula marina]RFB04695.1 flavin reductase [Parvularcula marina]
MSDPYQPLKNAFARYTTGVTVVSCLPKDGKPVALTVNSFTSVSLEPTLVLWCLDNHTSIKPSFDESASYAVSVLASDQQAVSNRFATPGRHDVTPAESETFATGSPLLKGRLAGFDCEIVARHQAGDHVVLIGQVKHFDSRDGAPLIYSGRTYLTGTLISD